MSKGATESRENMRFSGAGVTGNWESLNLYKTELRSSARKVCVPNS